MQFRARCQRLVAILRPVDLSRSAQELSPSRSIRSFSRPLVVLDQRPLSFLEDGQMNQNQLYREVAHATGESVGLIRSLGFNVVIAPAGLDKAHYQAMVRTLRA